MFCSSRSIRSSFFAFLFFILLWPTTNALATVSSELNQKNPLPTKAQKMEPPLVFEPNQVQVDSNAKFLARGSGYNLFLDQDKAFLSLRKEEGQSSLG